MSKSNVVKQETELPPINVRDGRTTPRQKRFGAIIGMRIALMLKRSGEASASAIANRLKLKESYVRRICRAGVADGLLTVRAVAQRGTRSVQLFSNAD